jgi:PST family polysaccharide transporter
MAFIPLGRPLAAILLGERWRGTGPIMMAMAGVGAALALDSISAEVFKATGRTDLLPRMHGLSAVVPLAFMFPLLHFGAPGMGLAMSLGTGTVAAYAVWGLSGIGRIPLRIIVAQIRPAASCALLMATGVYLVDRYIVQAGQSKGLLGLGLLALDALAAAVLYLGSLSLFSRRSIVELKELGKLLVSRIDRSASTAG